MADKDSPKENSPDADSPDENSLIEKALKLLRGEDLAEEIEDKLVHDRGALGYILGILRRRPQTFNPFVLKNMKLADVLDKKTAALVAVSAASALRCEHCLEVQMASAVAQGATMEEIMETLLISGAIADSSTLSVAFRKYRQLEGKIQKKC